MNKQSFEETTYEQWKYITIVALMDKAYMDKEVATTHYVMSEDHYKDCYNANMSPEDAVIEDIRHFD